MACTVFPTKSATREIARLPRWQHDAVIKRIEMEGNPRLIGAAKLSGRKEYKLRVGNLRVIYGISDRTKEVLIYM